MVGCGDVKEGEKGKNCMQRYCCCCCCWEYRKQYSTVPDHRTGRYGTVYACPGCAVGWRGAPHRRLVAEVTWLTAIVGAHCVRWLACRPITVTLRSKTLPASQHEEAAESAALEPLALIQSQRDPDSIPDPITCARE